MAIAKSPGGNDANGNKTSEASTAIPIGTGYVAGQLVVVCIAADNSGTSGASAISSVTDSQNNTYVQRVLKNQSPGSAANDGLTLAIYSSVIQTALSTSDTITVHYSPNVIAKFLNAIGFTGSGGTPYEAGSNSGTAGANYTVTTTASLLIGDLIVGCQGDESNVPGGDDADTSGGSWVNAGSGSSGGSGGDATKMALNTNYKVVTATGTQTFNGTNGATTDWAAAYILVRPALSPPFAAKSHVRNALVR